MEVIADISEGLLLEEYATCQLDIRPCLVPCSFEFFQFLRVKVIVDERERPTSLEQSKKSVLVLMMCEN